MKRILWALSLAAVVIGPSAAQRRLEHSQTHERILAIVPMIGTGTFADPRRPMFTPSPTDRTSAALQRAQERLGIIGFGFEASDDGKFALVEFVARDRSGFDEVMRALGTQVKFFRRGFDRKADIELEFRKYKKDFDLDQLRVVVP